MRRYRVSFSKTSSQILRHLHPDLKRLIRTSLGDLSKNPYTGKLLTGELTGLWSLRVSRHRIIYQIQQRRIAVVHIGPRKDVYEQLREMLTREKPRALTELSCSFTYGPLASIEPVTPVVRNVIAACIADLGNSRTPLFLLNDVTRFRNRFSPENFGPR